jgi:acyl transferase domain-containing protein
VAHSLRVGRSAYSSRLAIIADDAQTAARALTGEVTATARIDKTRAREAQVAWVFGGASGPSSSDVARLASAEPLFAAAWKEASDALDAHGGSAAPSCAAFAWGYALARTLAQAGVDPAMLCGLGVGELVCAVLTKALDLADAAGHAAAFGGAEYGGAYQSAPVALPQRAWISGRDGNWLTPERAIAGEHWSALPTSVPATQACAETLAAAGATIAVVMATDPSLPPEFAACGEVLACPIGGDPLRALQTVVAGLWCAGVDVRWSELTLSVTNGARRFVSLPGYPFARERFWLEPSPAPTAQVGDRARLDSPYGMTVTKTPSVDDWFYRQSWKRSAPVALLDQLDPSVQRGRFLVFADGGGLGRAVAAELIARRQEVVLVKAGDCFRAEGNGDFSLRPAAAPDLDELLKALPWRPTHVAHFLAVAPLGRSPAQDDELGAVSLLELVRALERTGVRELVNLTAFAAHAQDLTGAEPLAPRRIAAAGVCKCLPQDYKHMTAQFVDVELPALEPARLARQAAHLADELLAIAYDQLIAWRGDHRWVRAYPRDPLPAPTPQVAASVCAHAFCVIPSLDVGLACAHAFAVLGARRVTLVAPAQVVEPLAERVAAHMARADITVLVQAAAPSDGPALRAARREAEERFGPVTVVLHRGIDREAEFRFVGAVESGALCAELDAVAAQVAAWRTAFPESPGPRSLFCSSHLTVFAGIGKCEAFAAYALLDHLVATSAREHSVDVHVIDGEGWFEIAHDDDGLPVLPADAAANPAIMTDSELATVLARALTLPGLGQAVVTPMDVPAREDWVKRNILKHNRDNPSSVREQVKNGLHARAAGKDSDAELTAARTPTEAALAGIVAELTGEAVDNVHANLFDLGWDSLLVLEAVPRIRSDLKVDLPVRSLLEQASVAELAALIDGRLAEDASRADSLDENDLLERLLAEIESMSPAEVSAALAIEAPGMEGWCW